MPNSRDNATVLMNTMRTMGSDDYKSAVPLIDSNTNLNTFMIPFIEGSEWTPVQNEFCSLINRLALVIIRDDVYENRLSQLKSEYVPPLGTDIEDTWTNPVNPFEYDGKALDRILKYYETDTKAVIYRLNRLDVFPLSITRDKIANAFNSWYELDKFLHQQINALYSGNASREQNIFKQATVEAVNNGVCKTQYIPYPTAENSKNSVALIKTISSKMQWESTDYNNYKEYVKAKYGVDETPVRTWTPRNRQLILIRSDILQIFGVEVLASAFNMSEVEFRDNMLEIDEFSYHPYDLNNRVQLSKVYSNIAMLICDRSFFKFYDVLLRTDGNHNGATMTRQLFLHAWQTLGVCPFANAVAFYTDDNTGYIGLNVSQNVVELTNETTNATVNFNSVPEMSPFTAEIQIISATKDGENITNVDDVLTVMLDNTAHTVKFATVGNATSGSYEFKYNLHASNSVFPNSIISVGITL